MTKRADGRGTLRERSDGRFEGRYRVTIDGRSTRRSVFGATREEALRKLTTALDARDRGEVVKLNRDSVGAYMGRWLEIVKPTLRYNTVVGYEGSIRRLIVPGLGTIRLSRLTAEQVAHWHADLRVSGCSAHAISNAHKVLCQALDQAVRWQTLPRNVATLVPKPRYRPQEMRPLTPEQVRQLLTTARGHPDEVLLTLAVTSGMRRGELLALQWRDVDLERGRLHVAATMVHQSGIGRVRSEPKTSSSARTITLTPSTVAALRRHRQESKVVGLHDGYVFTNSSGGSLSSKTLLNRWWVLRRAAGLPETTRFHDLRHTCATLLVEQGVPIPLVAAQLGHTPLVCAKTYAHATPTMAAQAVAVMDNLLRG